MNGGKAPISFHQWLACDNDVTKMTKRSVEVRHRIVSVIDVVSMSEKKARTKALSEIEAHKTLAQQARLLAAEIQDPSVKLILEKMASDHELQTRMLEAFVGVQKEEY